MLPQFRNSILLKSCQFFLFFTILLGLLLAAPGRAQASAPVLPPPAPKLIAPTDRVYISNLTPLLQWTAVNGAGAYYLQVSTDQNFGTIVMQKIVPGPAYMVQVSDNLQYGSTYYWKVTAMPLNNNGGSASTVRRFTLTIQKSPADGAYVASQTVTFRWANVPGALGYDFTLFSHPQNITYSGKLTSYTVSNLAYGGYYWQVCVTLSTGQYECPLVQPGDTLWGVMVTPPLPPAPQMSGPAAGSLFGKSDVLGFSWLALPASTPGGPFSYQVQVDTAPSFIHPVDDFKTGAGVNSYIPASFYPDGKYYWRVRSLNILATAGRWSAARAFSIDTVGPPAPLRLSPPDISYITATRPTFKWAKASGASSYELIIYTSQINLVFGPKWLSATSYTLSSADPALVAGKAYYWYVCDVDAAGNFMAHPEDGFLLNVAASLPAVPAAPTLTGPLDKALVSASPTLSWTLNGDPSQLYIEAQVSTNPEFTNIPGEYQPNITNVTTYAPALAQNGTYYWRVRAYDASGYTSVWSAVRSFTINNVGLAAPIQLAPAINANLTQPKVTFSWTAVAGAKSYTLWYDENGDPNPITVAGITKTSYTANLPYQYGGVSWHVFTNDAYGNSSMSATTPFYLPLQYFPADGAKTSNPGSLTFKWNAYPGLNNSYNLQVSVVNNGTPQVLFSVPNLSGTSYTPSSSQAQDMLPGTYIWSIQVVGPSHPPIPSYQYQLFITNALPAAPGLLTPSSVQISGPAMPEVFTWYNVAFASQYQFQESLTTNFSSAIQLTCVGDQPPLAGPTTSLVMGACPPPSGVIGPFTYYWRVRGLNMAGAPGPWSAVRKLKWYPGMFTPPITLSPRNGSFITNPQLTLSWSAVPSAAGYDLEFAPGALGNDVQPTRLGNVTSYKLPASLVQNTYYWQVRAYDAAGDTGPWSSPTQSFNVISGLSVPKTPTPTPSGSTPSTPTLTPTSTATLTPTSTPSTVSTAAPTVEPSATPSPTEPEAATDVPTVATPVTATEPSAGPTDTPPDTETPEPSPTPTPVVPAP